MDDDGGFHEVEKDGKLFLVYHHPKYRPKPQIKSPSSSAEVANHDHPPLPLFICPFVRWQKDSRYSNLFLINSSPEFVLSSKVPDHHLLPLFWCNNEKFGDGEYECGICFDSKFRTDYYFCAFCSRKYHKECVESPLRIKHPYHPHHSSLELYYRIGYTYCIRCGGDRAYGLIYHCTADQTFMHTTCAMKRIPIVIDQQKIHDHPLTFFPRQNSLTCNICGLIKKHPTYVCLRCNFVAHRGCEEFPHTIRISRHHHRISRVLSLRYEKWPCGVCRQSIDGNYGAYTCNECGDHYYAVHLHCALGKDVWDGEELKGVPEKDDIAQDAPPFCKISEGVVHYFLHDHHLRLEENILYDKNKFCEACVMPIIEDEFYSCAECDFILHETCLKARRRIQYALHPHPLTLKAIDNYDSNYSWCPVCSRNSGGFVYECPKQECQFKLDMRCALISEPFDYQGHEHPLFLSLDPYVYVLCKVCKWTQNYSLNCIKCDFTVCMKCATLPYKVRYNNDKHFLTLSWGEERREKYWCEECEDIVEKFFYWCNDCCTILHTDCLFSKNPYLKPGQVFKIREKEFQILAKSNTSRPICHFCKKPCQGKTLVRDNLTVCSMLCASDFMYSYLHI
ncbi:uncharacterized protein LOC130509753 [Raphanus sativus]|uniref:Uncharacterized protein LOC130509753 n=1 Tax=Raphanus sativus TaxID=3726 RepID=A0A9W3DDG8_RAPSA|nr:uncharacterized protein LOC130509753 [Raphanus sativus]